MINFIKKILQKESKSNTLLDEINRVYKKIPQDFGGGCSIEKALSMALLIKEFNLQNTVDIGVYRGRSLFPQAIAHKLYSNGIVYGVDPYSKEAANQIDFPEKQKQLDNFVTNTNFQELYINVSKIIDKNYKDNCILIREKSADGAVEFKNNKKKLDMVHIDGNHDTKFVMEDVKNYLPLLSERSFIILDDISWKSVSPALKLLNKKMDFIYKKIDKTNDFAVFSIGLTNDEIIHLKKKIEETIS
tara:strand:+ start:49746 stop:50480 length:735 start_codon:yes stop_codon:yes gene_type:complete